jgi:hypothetical protein
MEIGDRVEVTWEKGGRGMFYKYYKGTITRFTVNGRIKISDRDTVRIHAPRNVKPLKNNG